MIDAVAPRPTTFRLVPRPYQYEAVAALLAATARGIRRPLLVLPTGTGKTIVFALLVQRRHGRSLILAHRDELIQQAVAKTALGRSFSVARGCAGDARRAYRSYRGGQCADPEPPLPAEAPRAGFPAHRH